MGLTMRTVLCLLTALFLLASQAALASKIYRWVDADGQTHFGSQPPEQVHNAEELNLRIQPPSSTGQTTTENSTNGSAESSEQPTDEAQAEPTKPAIDPEVAARNCRLAKERIDQLSVNFNQRYKQADGTVRPLTDAERAAQTKQMNEVIQKYCK